MVIKTREKRGIAMMKENMLLQGTVEEKSEEKYLTTKEAAEQLGMDSSLLRYYCNQFETFVTIKKTDKGHRLFTQQNIDDLQSIFDIMKDRGMTVKQVSYYLNEYGLSMKKWDIPYPSLKEMENITDLVLRVKEEICELREETKDFKEKQKDTNDKLMSAMIQLASCQEESAKQLATGLESIQEISTYQRRMLPESKGGISKIWQMITGRRGQLTANSSK